MKLKVFDVEVWGWQERADQNVVYEFRESVENLGVEINSIEEITIYKDEISFIIYGTIFEGPGNPTKPELLVYYYNIKNEYFNNGGDEFDSDISWGLLRDFYMKYAQAETIFIEAIDKNMLVDAKAIHTKRPDILPSISNSFYARWLVKTNNIKFLEWAKSVDDNIDFSDKNRYENPLKLAIGYKYEAVALWLIDNYPEISLFPISGNKLNFIKEAQEEGLDKLVDRLRQDKEMMKLIMKSGDISLLPSDAQEMFIF